MEGSIIKDLRSFEINGNFPKNLLPFYTTFNELKGLQITVEKDNEIKHYFVALDMKNVCCENFDVDYNIDGIDTDLFDAAIGSTITSGKFAPSQNNSFGYTHEIFIMTSKHSCATEHIIKVDMYVEKNGYYPHSCVNNIYTYPDEDCFTIGFM